MFRENPNISRLKKFRLLILFLKINFYIHYHSFKPSWEFIRSVYHVIYINYKHISNSKLQINEALTGITTQVQAHAHTNQTIHTHTKLNHASNKGSQTSARLSSLTRLQHTLSKTVMKTTVHLTLIDQAGPVGTFVWTKGTIALFKSLERLYQLVMYQAPRYQG